MKFTGLFALLVLPLLWVQTLSGAPAGNKESAVTGSGGSVDPGWPRQVVRDGNRLVYYQPQVDQWNDLRRIKARVAIVFTPKGGKPAIGVEEFSGDTTTDLENRSVQITNLKPEAIRFLRGGIKERGHTGAIDLFF